MDEIRALTQTTLQTAQMGHAQDAQQRQTTVDQRAGLANFSQRAADRSHQVSGTAQAESDALSADGHSDGGRGETPGEEPGKPQAEAAPKEPDLGQTIDIRA